MDSNGIGRMNTPSTRPVRPPLPSPEKLATLRKQQSISTQVGSTPRKVRAADITETAKLSTNITPNEPSDEITKIPKKSLRERTTERLSEVKLSGKLDNWKEKGARFNEARKEWAKAPLTNSIALGISAKQAAGKKLKSSTGTAKEKLSHKKEQASNLLDRAKAGARIWNEAKIDTTVSVARSLYKGGKKRAGKQTKALAHYVIRIPSKIKAKLPSRTEHKETPEPSHKEIKTRKCSTVNQQPNTPPSQETK